MQASSDFVTKLGCFFIKKNYMNWSMLVQILGNLKRICVSLYLYIYKSVWVCVGVCVCVWVCVCVCLQGLNLSKMHFKWSSSTDRPIASSKFFRFIYLIFLDFFQKCMNALQQVVAREGRPILIGEEDDWETRGLTDKFIAIPHAVDCLQGERPFLTLYSS